MCVVFGLRVVKSSSFVQMSCAEELMYGHHFASVHETVVKTVVPCKTQFISVSFIPQGFNLCGDYLMGSTLVPLGSQVHNCNNYGNLPKQCFLLFWWM